MSTATYVQLTTSTSVNKWLRVLQGTLKPTFQKTQTRKRTVSGRSDNTEGAIIRGWSMTVKVKNITTGTDTDGANYAVLADLETFFSYNNANGTPTNRFTYTDHVGSTFTVELVGEMDEEHITPFFDGVNSWFYVALAMEKVN